MIQTGVCEISHLRARLSCWTATLAAICFESIHGFLFARLLIRAQVQILSLSQLLLHTWQPFSTRLLTSNDFSNNEIRQSFTLSCRNAFLYNVSTVFPNKCRLDWFLALNCTGFFFSFYSFSIDIFFSMMHVVCLENSSFGPQAFSDFLLLTLWRTSPFLGVNDSDLQFPAADSPSCASIRSKICQKKQIIDQ